MRNYLVEVLKYVVYCSSMIFSGIAISCESSPKITDISLNTSPIVSFSVNDSVITVGDTLYVSLKVSDSKGLNGTLDFGDSSLIYFSNIKNVDTTIYHVYSKVGWYLIKTSFSNSDTSLKVSTYVKVVKYFAMYLKVGMSWKYYYDYYSSYPTGYAGSQKGVHEWKVMSLSIAGQDTTFNIEETRNDTVYSEGWNSQGHYDTTYIDNKIFQFDIIQSYNKTTFNISLPRGIETFIIPNHQFVDSYPYTTQNYGSAAFNENGLIGYYRGSPGGLITLKETLSLIEFREP